MSLAPLRKVLTDLEEQQILAVSKLGMDNPDVIPMWYGESDLPTPDFICKAALPGQRPRDTMYTHKRGIPPLRQAIRRYTEALYDVPLDEERITVTTSGMTAIMLTLQMILNPGENVLIVSPVWPNAQAAVRLLGGEPRFVTLDATEEGFALDLDKLFDACDDNTRAIFINSPNNPTGWMMDNAQQRAVIEFAREKGIWVIADEVYARMVYDRRAAPSFLEVAKPEDPLFVINSFSKSWAMTGWRLGWIVHPERVGYYLGNTIEYNYSCVQPFLQHAGVTAMCDGEGFVREMVEYCRKGRAVISEAFPKIDGIEGYREADASFYAFFRVRGVKDTLRYAQRLVTDAGIGIAPGTAFGPGAEGWFRLCFAQRPELLQEAMRRLAGAVGRIPG